MWLCLSVSVWVVVFDCRRGCCCPLNVSRGKTKRSSKDSEYECVKCPNGVFIDFEAFAKVENRGQSVCSLGRQQLLLCWNLRRTGMLCIMILAATTCVSGDGFLHGCWGVHNCSGLETTQNSSCLVHGLRFLLYPTCIMQCPGQWDWPDCHCHLGWCCMLISLTLCCFWSMHFVAFLGLELENAKVKQEST